MRMPRFFKLILLLALLTMSSGAVDVSASRSDGVQTPVSSAQAPASPDATPGELRSYATIHSIGIEWDISGDDDHDAECQVQYRIQGASAWEQALPLFRVDFNASNMLAGSIFFLEPGSNYEIQLTLSDPDGGSDSQIVTIATRPVPSIPVGGRTFHVVPGTGGGDGSESNPFQGIDAAQAGSVYYVDVESVEGTCSDSNPGTITEPWCTVGKAISILTAGDTLYLRAGIYYESNLDIDMSGEESNWITIKNYPGENPVIDGGYREFRTVPNNDWELYDAEKNIYRSVNVYTETGNAEGYLGADNGGFHLVPYEDYGHLSTSNEFYSLEGDGYADGWIYIGPGMFRDLDNRIYIRLTPSQEELSVGYSVPSSTDPRQVQMFIFPKGSKQRLLHFLENASYIRIEGIEMRYMSRILEFKRGSHHITIENCDIIGGQYHVVVREEVNNLLFDGISINDSLPPWIAWFDVKSGRKPGHSFQQAGITIGDDAHDIEIKNSVFKNVFDGIDAIGSVYNLHIHDNLFVGTRDDAITIGSSAHNVEINNNKAIACHVAFSYAGTGSTVQPGTKFIHHNVIDASTPMLLWRDDPYELGSQKIVGDDGMGWRKPFGSHAGSGYGDGDSWKIYSNTVIGGTDYDRGGLGYMYRRNENVTGRPQEVYNNIFMTSTDSKMEYSIDTDTGYGIYDGNLYFSQASPQTVPFFEYINGNNHYFDLAAFQAGTGQEANAIQADPRLDENYRPDKDSPAATGALDLTGRGWPGVDGSVYRGALAPIEEANGELVLSGAPADQAIHLTWQIGASLPPTSTWQLAYDGPTGDQPSPISGIISPTRAYTLTGLTNYTWYTVTLNAMSDSTPFLTDTVHVMPTDIFVYLPLVLKGP